MRSNFGRPSPALVIACISLFVALGGVGYAAATGSIDGREIKNNSVASKDVKNNSLVGKDVKASGLNGTDIQANSLTGADITESGLGKVPSAGQADNAGTASTANTANSAGNANTVDGQSIVPFVYRSDNTATRTTLANVGGLLVQATCGSADNDLFLKNQSGAVAQLTLGGADATDVNTGADAQEGKSNSALANAAEENAASAVPDAAVTGQATFVTSANTVVNVVYSLNEAVNGFDCSIAGQVIG